MLISIITPSHKLTPYLLELYESICNQTYSNWEWVLWLNNGFTLDQVPSCIAEDNKVKVYLSPEDNPNIGYHKHHAFSLGKGEVLVEADHDDLLLPNCLEEIAAAFQDPTVGFAYSNNAKLHMTGEFNPYSSLYGWAHNKFQFRGQELWAPQSFQATSHSLMYIWYSPDHVRAWRAPMYYQLKGHNPNLEVLDDQDLMIRTYLNFKFKFIDKVLYVYRITGDNSWLAKNKMIQENTVAIGYHYAQALAERDATLNNKFKVELGGGRNPLPYYLNIDQRHGDIKHDLNQGIPLEDNSVGVINASHIIEHLYDKQKTMAEIHRVLHHGGWVFIDVPSTDGRGAWQDPTHVSFWNQNSFMYYTQKEQADFIDNTSVRFQQVRCETIYPNDWYKQHKIPVVRAWLIAIKQDKPRFPGLLSI